jgi:hypothetical protein
MRLVTKKASLNRNFLRAHNILKRINTYSIFFYNELQYFEMHKLVYFENI